MCIRDSNISVDAGFGKAEYFAEDVVLDEDAIVTSIEMLLYPSMADGHLDMWSVATVSHMAGVLWYESDKPHEVELGASDKSMRDRVNIKERLGAYVKLKAEESLRIHGFHAAYNPSSGSLTGATYIIINLRVKG